MHVCIVSLISFRHQEPLSVHLEETETSASNTAFSVTLPSLSCILRSVAGMTFYDDIYPFYPPQRTSFIFSGRLLTIILVFLVLAVSLLLILPGIRGRTVSVQRTGWPVGSQLLTSSGPPCVQTTQPSAASGCTRLFLLNTLDSFCFVIEAVLDVQDNYQLVHWCGFSGWVWSS